MSVRMLCVDCGKTAFADTWLEGSDRVECAAWLLGGVPGWLYCAWRHALRTKTCAGCGSGALARETHASSRSAPVAPPSTGVRIRSRRGRVAWPASLRDPRARMRRGPLCVALWLVAIAGPALLAAALGGLWLIGEGLAASRTSDHGTCRAWDASGRPLPIEIA